MPPPAWNIPASELFPAVAVAAAGYRHAEIVVQQRLYNFLMAASILLLGAAATVSTGETLQRRLFLCLIAGVGAALSGAWVVLGRRQRKFIDLQAAIIVALESLIPDELRVLRVFEPIAQLQRGHEVTIQRDGKKMTLCLSAREMQARSSNLLIFAPATLTVVFVALIVIAACGWQ